MNQEQGIDQSQIAAGAATTNAKEVAAPKRRGRGLNNDVVATSRLKFKPKDANPNNGLFEAHLDSVELRYSNVADDNLARPSFTGLSVPYIVFTFASNEPEVSRRKYITHNIMAVESNANTIPGGSEEWKIDQVLRYMKHMLDVFVLKGQPMSAQMEAALTLPFEDFDEEGSYVAIEAEQVVKGWSIVFENYVNIINTTNNGKPAFVNPSNGNFIPVWIKLLASVKSAGRNGNGGWKNINKNGELSFPAFTGEGVVEIIKNGVQPVIRINALSESITPRATEEAKTPTPLPQTGGMMGGMPAPDMMSGGAQMANIATDDMPFGSDAPF